MDLEDEDFLEKAFRRAEGQARPSWAFKNLEGDMDSALNNVPLFMQTTENNNNTDAVNNTDLEALQALLFEGTAQEQATNFKNQGNEAYADGCRYNKNINNDYGIKSEYVKGYGKMARESWKTAVKFYSRGLEDVQPQSEVSPELRANLMLNRAAANLALQNYGWVKQDCKKILQMLSENQNINVDSWREKAFLRFGKACMALHQYREFLEESSECATSEAVQRMRNEAQKLLDKHTQIQKLSPLDLLLGQKGLHKVAGAEQAILGELPPYPPQSLPTVHIQEGGFVAFPVMLFYPPYGRTDFIESWHESTTIGEQLAEVLRYKHEWDTENMYSSDDIKHITVFIRGTSREEPFVILSWNDSLTSLIGKAVIREYEYGLLGMYVLPAQQAQAFLLRAQENVLSSEQTQMNQ